ncbi:hypothetical protein ISS04_03460 [Candidatus Woesearchaeota archaeon]|nr:hypothetical protein [Candidatus Woesearchaeota archaeon]
MNIENLIEKLPVKEAEEIYDLRKTHSLDLNAMASTADISKDILISYYTRVADMRIKQHVNKEAPYLNSILQCYEIALDSAMTYVDKVMDNKNKEK